MLRCRRSIRIARSAGMPIAAQSRVMNLATAASPRLSGHLASMSGPVLRNERGGLDTIGDASRISLHWICERIVEPIVASIVNEGLLERDDRSSAQPGAGSRPGCALTQVVWGSRGTVGRVGADALHRFDSDRAVRSALCGARCTARCAVQAPRAARGPCSARDHGWRIEPMVRRRSLPASAPAPPGSTMAPIVRMCRSIKSRGVATQRAASCREGRAKGVARFLTELRP